MAQDRVVEVLLRYAVDSKSAKEVEAVQKRITRGMEMYQAEVKASTDVTSAFNRELGKISRENKLNDIARRFTTLKQTGSTASQALEEIQLDLIAIGATDKEIARVVGQMTKLADASDRAAASSRRASVSNAAAVTDSAGGSGRLHQRSRLSRFGSELRQLPSIGIPGAGFGTDAIANIIRVGGAVQEVSASFKGMESVLTQLVMVSPLAAVTTIALVQAIQQFLEVIDDGKARVDAALVAQKAYYAAITEFTTQQAAAQIADLQRERTALEQQAAETRNALETARNQANSDIADVIITPFGMPIVGVGEQLANVTGAFNNLENAAAEAEKALQANINEETRLAQGLEAGAFTTNDARAALIKFYEQLGETPSRLGEFLQQVNEFTEKFGQNQVQQAEQGRQAALNLANEEARIRSGTVKAAEERFSALMRERQAVIDARNALQATGNDSQAVRDQIEAYNQQLREQSLILQMIASIIPQLREVEALDHLQAETLEYLDAVEAVAEAQRDLNALEQEHAQQVNEIIANRERQLAEAEAEAARRREEILANANEESQALTEDYNQDRLRAEEDLQNDLRRIQRRFNLDMLNAIGERDALAAFQAQQRRREEVTEARQQARTEEQRRREDYNKRLREIQDSATRALQTLQAETQRKLQTITEGANRALAIEAQKYAAELQMRQQALELMVQQYVVALSQIRAAAAEAGRNIVTEDQYDTVNGSFAQLQALGIIQPDAVNVAGSFAGGIDYVPHDMVARVHEGERIVTAAENRRSGGGNQANITINMDGRSLRAASRREAVRYVGEMLGDLEIE